MSRRRRSVLNLELLEGRDLPSTFYVAPGGNNGNSGSSSAPWQTLQYAAGRVTAGDTVIARAGNYAGFYLTTDGTAAAPITFRGDPGATIDTRNPTTPDGINLEGADYIVIEGFRVVNQPRTGIRSVINHHVTIRNNFLDNNERWGILTGFSNDLLIENNQASNSHVEHGIYVSNSGDRPVIRGNLVFGNYANGIHMNGDLSQGGDGVISNALVENNIIYGNGTGGGSGINCDGVQNSTIRNNLIYNTMASGISLYRIDGGGGSSNNLVVNNTVLVAATGRWAMNIQSGSTGNTLRNNIFYSAHSFRGSIDISANSLPGFSSDYNVVMDRFTTDGGNTRLTLAGWQSATGQDTHSLVATPAQLFVNVAGNDYHLSPTSPALDRGTTSIAPASDLEGLPRPSGPGVDIGAYERQAASSAGTLALTVSSLSVNESAGTATLTVSRSGGSSGAVGVQYATSNGSATAGSDYLAAGGTLSWADGDTSPKSITITILDDSIFEGNETFSVVLSNPTGGATLGSPAAATVTIVDNEQAPPGTLVLSVSAVSVNESAGTVSVTVQRTGGSNGAVSVQYATANGTATAGADYTAAGGTLSWASGDASPRTITVPILEDTLFEGSETFTVALSNPTGGAALGSPSTATVTIVDNDRPPGRRKLAAASDAGSEPRVRVYDGETGQQVLTFLAYGSPFTGGVRVTTADFNGDGVPEIITAPGATTVAAAAARVRIFDGASGLPLPGAWGTGVRVFAAPYQGGVSIAVGDLNRDGIADIIAAPDSGSPLVRSYNGATGAQLPGPLGSFSAFSSTSTGGVRVAAGDVNGDGAIDIIAAQAVTPGEIRVYSGASTGSTPTRLRAFRPFAGIAGGVTVAAADVNGDGRAEIIAGLGSSRGEVRIFGPSNTPLRSFRPFGTSYNYGVRVAVGDINDDGKLDLAVGQVRGPGAQVRLYDAATLQEFFAGSTRLTPFPTATNGPFVAAG